MTAPAKIQTWRGVLIHPVILEADGPNDRRIIVGFPRGERVFIRSDDSLPNFVGQGELQEISNIVGEVNRASRKKRG